MVVLLSEIELSRRFSILPWGVSFWLCWGANQAARAKPDARAEGFPADLKIRILQDLRCQPKATKCKALLSTRQVPPLDSDFFFWKLPDLDFLIKIKHSTLRKKHETKSHTLYMLSHNQGCLRCVLCFCVFSVFLVFLVFLVFVFFRLCVLSW